MASKQLRSSDPISRIAIVVVLGAIMSTLDTTVVNVALNSLSRDLHTGLNEIQWVVTSYLLALAAVIPLGGWATRRFSAYRVYLWALTVFTIGSALCATAVNAPELVAFRALQGIGGGLIMPTGMTMLVRATPRADLPKVMSAIGTPMVLAPVLGPTFGGFLLQSVSWHAIFAINIPVGIGAGLAAARLLPRDVPELHAGKLDWIGLFLASAAVVAITYGLSQSPTAGSIIASPVLIPVVAGCLLLFTFVVRARHVTAPLVDIRLYAVPSYSAASLVMFTFCAALFGAMILLPLYFQTVRGLGPMASGLLLIPQGVGAAFGLNRSAAATARLGAGLTSVLGLLAVSVCTIPFVLVGPSTPYWLLGLAMLARGAGVGLAINPANSAAYAMLEDRQVSDASPQLNVVQRIGSSLGTAVIVVMLQSHLVHASGGPAGAADAFDTSYLWVMGLQCLALIPAVMLWRLDRRSRTTLASAELPSELLVVEPVT